MSPWHRVFGAVDVAPEPAALLEFLHGCGWPVVGQFRGDEQGWFAARLILPEGEAALELERYLVGEEGVRAELNTWAAWLESRGAEALMTRMIGTRQVFTLHGDEEAEPRICRELCLYLARATEGLWQADGLGLVDAGGDVLISERQEV